MSTGEQPAAIAQLIGLTHVFTPKQAAEILRSIGLEEITECALRTRAYRKQVPFHLNGHRIIFTAEDLHEIAEGKPCRPQADQTGGLQDQIALPSPAQPGSTTRTGDQEREVWRARRPRHA